LGLAGAGIPSPSPTLLFGGIDRDGPGRDGKKAGKNDGQAMHDSLLP
jgi:hypothetical protein